MLRQTSVLLGVAGLLVVAAAACGGEDANQRPPPPPPRPALVVDAGPKVGDVLPARPDLGEPPAFVPPVPVEYKRENGLTVWLLERHTLPIVSMQVVVRSGSATDPNLKEGLAHTTANMLDEGAGTRGALELSKEIDRLGATLTTGAAPDFSFAQLTVLKKNLAPAAALLGDVVSRPQLSAVEWKRVRDLWENQLKARQSEPEAVASVVVDRFVYQVNHGYARPVSGTVASTKKVTLEDVKKFYADRWRPDDAVLVVVGDITRADLDKVIDQAFSGWKTPKTPIPAAAAPPAPLPAVAGRKVVVVDRADAPQSVIAVARPGVLSSDLESAPVVRINAALGGSFTSRLNQDLREEHGWSYGAGSRFSANRMRGSFVARAAVHTEHTGEALKAMLGDIDGMAKKGLTTEEVEKTKKLVRADLVEAFETAKAAASRLGRNAGLGLAPDHDATTSKAVARADKAALDRLAATHLDLTNGVVVIVGPRAKIEPQLRAIGIERNDVVTPEGEPVGIKGGSGSAREGTFGAAGGPGTGAL